MAARTARGRDRGLAAGTYRASLTRPSEKHIYAQCSIETHITCGGIVLDQQCVDGLIGHGTYPGGKVTTVHQKVTISWMA
jgi:hypothetical protein